MLIESGLPVRWYLPRDDVRADLLEPSDTTTRCPYKGVARYWSLRLEGRLVRDVAWSYPEPAHDAEAVGGFLCFFDDRVDLAVEDALRLATCRGREPLAGYARASYTAPVTAA